MKYRVLWTKTAVRCLRKLDRETAKRIIDSVEEASEKPFKYIKKLYGMPFYSLRIGDYRAILAVDSSKQTIVVLEVEHRKKVYEHFRKRFKKN
ncbi:MAG TPA: type II toxin-antitoxin system RelE/ParE family toxin [Thermoprotei archaeon]|nr:MAG: type II toxin-antitoxin system RelE/ParE family toxin [Thermoprotei archaeon]HDI75095.1 type II toxin-antitoxin system RelE/ParE family toxin [Thermoprotei archaeon]